MADGLARGAEAAALVVLAPSCATCGTMLQHLRNDPLCERCWAAVRPFTPPFCDRCGDPQPSWRQRPAHEIRPSIDRTVSDVDEPTVCSHCTVEPGAVTRARAIGSHEGALRDIIHALKYGKRQSVAARLGRLMRLHGADVLAGADIAIPVPLHWSRRYRRGFNQAELLAAQLGLPVGRLLRRVRRTRPQVDLPARERQANVERAFALRRRDGWRLPAWLQPRIGTRLDGLTVVLVDDVTTTGATVEACARVLRGAGAKEVRVITAARVATKSR